jgi:hypothetical protein
MCLKLQRHKVFFLNLNIFKAQESHGFSAKNIIKILSKIKSLRLKNTQNIPRAFVIANQNKFL